MTTKALSFTGTLTLQDTLDLHHYRSLLVVRRSIRWLLAIFSLLIIAVVLVAGVYSHFSWPSYVILAVFVYFLLSCFGLDERLRVARHYRRHPDQYVESTVALSEDSVSVLGDIYKNNLLVAWGGADAGECWCKLCWWYLGDVADAVCRGQKQRLLSKCPTM